MAAVGSLQLIYGDKPTTRDVLPENPASLNWNFPFMIPRSGLTCH